MEAVTALALGIVVFMQGLQILGLSAPKTTGIVGAAGAIVLIALIALKPFPMLMAGASAAAFSTSMLIWAVYATLVAAVGLWDFDPRGLGLYSAMAAIAMLGQVVFSIVTKFSLTGIICGTIQFIAFAMLFFYLAIPFKALKKATAWVLVVVGPIHGILAVLLLAGIPGLT